LRVYERQCVPRFDRMTHSMQARYAAACSPVSAYSMNMEQISHSIPRELTLELVQLCPASSPDVVVTVCCELK